MVRAWRIEYDGALYHGMSRGNERNDFFLDKATKILRFDFKRLQQSCRISGQEKDNRDLLIYALGKTSMMTNKKWGHFLE